MAIVSCGELALAASDSGLAIPSLVLVLVGLVLVLVAKMRARSGSMLASGIVSRKL